MEYLSELAPYCLCFLCSINTKGDIMEKFIKRYGYLLTLLAVTYIWVRFILLNVLNYQQKLIYTGIYFIYIVLVLLKVYKQ